VLYDPRDACAKILQLTEAGERLTLDSLQVTAELERRCAGAIGERRPAVTLEALTAFVERAGGTGLTDRPP
jgi:hypothetical protein